METCPTCGHEAHSVGDRECEEVVQHGPKRWHRCLCLNRPGADKTCPPLMDCQGGPLGYSDIYYLQRGHRLSSKDGPISPAILGVPLCPGGACFHPGSEHSVYGCAEGCGCTWMPRKTGPCSDPPCGYEKGELCDTHHTEKAHAEGDHQWCDITCQDEYTWEMLRNTILIRAIPGSPKMLDELLRRAADRSALMEAHIALVSTTSQIRATYDTLKAEYDELAARMEGLEK
jgi:hypothetical protein